MINNLQFCFDDFSYLTDENVIFTLGWVSDDVISNFYASVKSFIESKAAHWSL